MEGYLLLFLYTLLARVGEYSPIWFPIMFAAFWVIFVGKFSWRLVAIFIVIELLAIGLAFWIDIRLLPYFERTWDG